MCSIYDNHVARLQENAPFSSWVCADEKHAYEECQALDTLMRVKAYERERRLLARMDRKIKAGTTPVPPPLGQQQAVEA